MLQSYATNTAGNSRIRMLDLQPDRDTPSPFADGRRWQSGDPSPVAYECDYQDGVLACERNPVRYRPEMMSDDEHAAMVKAFKEAHP
jgi:hypothetical protein